MYYRDVFYGVMSLFAIALAVGNFTLIVIVFTSILPDLRTILMRMEASAFDLTKISRRMEPDAGLRNSSVNDQESPTRN